MRSEDVTAAMTGFPYRYEVTSFEHGLSIMAFFDCCGRDADAEIKVVPWALEFAPRRLIDKIEAFRAKEGHYAN